jgi:uncharacterized DUF497 family protein
MKFEYDPAKSESNKAKHGIDFEEAQALWNNELLEIPSPHDGESRSLLIGRIEGKHWTAVVTRRDEALRIISCRRSRKEEVAWYEDKDTC